MTSKLPIFIYSMVLAGNTAYRDFFDSGPLKSLLEDPGQ
jgi:hypothetical protein